jgi:hypothetical protein
MYRKEIERKPESTEFILMKTKTITDVHCKGKMPVTGEICGALLYQTDGEFIYVLGNAINIGLDKQHLKCNKCGYSNVWWRNSEFILPKDKKSDKNKFKRPDWRK